MALLWAKNPVPTHILGAIGPAGQAVDLSADYGVPINQSDPLMVEYLRAMYPHALDLRAGVPIRLATNYVRNPSVETNTTDLNSFVGSTGGTGGSTSVARITSDFRYGGACAQWTISPQTGGTGLYCAIFHQIYTSVANLQATAMPVVPGQTVWFTASAKAVSGNYSSVSIYIRYHDAAGNFLNQLSVANQNAPVAGTWYDFSGSHVAIANAAYALVRVQPNFADSTAAVMLTDGVGIYDANPYGFFDGSMGGVTAWEGTAHASRSYRQMANELTNPSAALVLSPWSAGGGPVVNVPLARITTDGIDGTAGEFTFQAGTNTGLAGQIYPLVTGTGGGPIRANPGNVFSAGLWVKVASGITGVSTVRCDIGFKNGTTGAFITQPTGPGVAPTGNWQFVKIENVAVPANAGDNAIVYMAGAARASGTDVPVVFRADQAMIVRAPTLPTWYIAGDQDGSQWQGTAHASPSIKLA